jgi:hypothetical protein
MTITSDVNKNELIAPISVDDIDTASMRTYTSPESADAADVEQYCLDCYVDEQEAHEICVDLEAILGHPVGLYVPEQ